MDSNCVAPEVQELEQMDLFLGVDISRIGDLLEQCEIVQLNKGDLLVAAGETNKCLYLLLSGRLSVYLPDRDRQPVAVLKVGDSVGEISVIDRQPATANVLARSPTRLLQIEEDLLWRIVQRSHGVAVNLLTILSQRLRQGNLVINKIQRKMRHYAYDATTDPLTGLFNRRWLDNMLSRIVHRCVANGYPLSVIMMDIDHFKNFNDFHGHQAGDQALRAVSKALINNLRPEDTVTRYGGEELLAVLPNSSLTRAEQVAERLRQIVEQTPIQDENGDQLPPVTLSLGIAELQPEQRPSDLIEQADQAMYRAKHLGRNRVCA